MTVLGRTINQLFRKMSNTIIYTFSQKRRLHPLSQRSVFSTKVIRLINQAPRPTELDDPNLAQLIKKIDFTHEEFHFDKQIKDEMCQIFQNGIFLNRKVFAQSRLKQFEQNPIWSGYQQNLADKFTNFKLNINQGKFKFYPNYLVTKNIFDVMPVGNNILITGGYGISKTITIILYIHFSGYITHLQMLAKKNSQLREELNMLVKKNLILEDHPKFWYWSIDMVNDQTKKYKIQQIIREQAFQLTKEQRQSLQLFSQDFKSKIAHFYYPFKNIVVIDQVNSLASSMNKWNKSFFSYQNEIQKNSMNKQIQTGYQNNKNAIYKPACNIYQKFYNFICFGNSYILNSSADIEKNLLQADHNSSNQAHPLYLNLTNHNRYEQIDIPFQQYLAQTWGKISFLQYFWFQTQKMLLKNNISTDQISNAKKKFYDEAKKRLQKNEKIVRSFYRLLHVSDFYREKFQKIKVTDKQERQNILNMPEILNNFQSFSLQMCQQKLKVFISKKPKERKQILSLIYIFSQQMIKENSQQNNKLQFSLDQIGQILKMTRENVKKLLQSEDHSKQTLPYEWKSGQSKVNFLMTPKEFVSITKDILIQPKQIQIGVLFNNLMTKYIINRPVSRGQLFEQIILQALIPKTRFQIVVIQPNSLRYWDAFTLESSVISFRPFNSKQNTPAFVNYQFPTINGNFSELLQMSKSQPNNFFAGIPCWKYQDKIIFQDKNPSTDFVIINYSSNKFIIRSFDLTISTNLSQKITKATNLYSGYFNNPQKREYSMIHYIVAPSVAIENQLKKSRNPKQPIQNSESFKIEFIASDLMKIDCPNEQVQSLFKTVQKINKFIQIKKLKKKK